MTEPVNFSVIERKMSRFINLYGSDELIRYLDNYDRHFDKNGSDIWLKIREIACNEYNIPNAQILRNFRAIKSVDARRAAVYCAVINGKLSIKNLSALTEMSKRNLYSYKDTAEQWIMDPRQYPDFIKKFEIISKKFLAWLNNRTI